MREWKQAVAGVCAAVGICYLLIMVLGSQGVMGLFIPVVCFAAFGMLCVVLRSIPGLREKKKLVLVSETILVMAAAVCMILFV